MLEGSPDARATAGRCGMNWKIGLLSVGVLVLGAALDRRRRQERQRLPRPDIERWEEEGGAVPTSDDRTAAQTATIAPSAS